MLIYLTVQGGISIPFCSSVHLSGTHKQQGNITFLRFWGYDFNFVSQINLNLTKSSYVCFCEWTQAVEIYYHLTKISISIFTQ